MKSTKNYSPSQKNNHSYSRLGKNEPLTYKKNEQFQLGVARFPLHAL